MRAGESGQSTIEFALVLMLLMGFVLFYLQLSMVMGFGNYVHYATFMSARAYLSAGASEPEQVERANAVVERMLKRANSPGFDRFPSIAKGEGGGGEMRGLEVGKAAQFNASNPDLSWMQGVRYAFKSRLFLIPLGRGGGGAQGPASGNGIVLRSESWLGREPSYDDCKSFLGTKQGIFDNGC